MAINAQKLLPPGRLTTAERMSAAYDKRIDDLLNVQIKTKLINVDKLLKKNTTEKKKQSVAKKKREETDEREKKEKRLERGKEASKFNLKIPSLPQTGFLDTLQNFLSYTFLGYLIGNYYEYLPRLLNFAKILGPALKTVESIVVGTFEAGVFLIDAGYKAKNELSNQIGKLGGKDAQKTFDKFTTNFRDMINSIMTLGLYQSKSKTPQQRNGGPVKKLASGGNITRAGIPINKPVSRAITTTRQKPRIKVKPQQSQPGKDVGGKKKIQKLFPDPLDSPTPDTRAINPLRSLKTTSKNLKQIPFLGGIMGAAVDLAMGQKPERGFYRSFGSAIGSLIQNSIDNQTNLTVNDISKTVFAMANGGPISRGITKKRTTGEEIGIQIAKMIEIDMNNRINKIFNDITKELSLRGGGTYGEEIPIGTPLDEGEIASGTKLMQGLVQRGFTKEEASAIVGNLWAESGFRTGSTNPTSGAYGLMQWVGGRKSRLFTYAAEKGRSVSDVELQLDYIKWELKGGNAYETEQFKKAMAYGPDVAAKTKGFAEQVERPSSSELSSSMSKRIGAAESVYSGKMVKGETPSISLGKGYGSAGVRIAGDLGRFMKNLGIVPGSIHEHPDFGGVKGGHARGSLHYQGRAIDLGAWAWEQGPILKAVESFNRKKGVNPVQLFHAGNDPLGHSDHVHVAYAKGGLVSKPTRAIIGEKGPEYVFDADTTKSLEGIAPGLLHKLNMAKTKKEVNSILQSYADYENGGKEFVFVLSEKIVMMDQDSPINFRSSPQSIQNLGLNSRVPTSVG